MYDIISHIDCEELDSLPSAEQAELQALHHSSDDTLKTIAGEQMSVENQALMAKLMERNTQGILTEDERVVLEELVERGDQLMLRKAEAAAIIVQRGYNSSPNELIRPNGE